MPVCKACQIRFPLKKIIDGKRRNLAGRSYCLTCSPFGQHNTSKIEISGKRIYTCASCNKEYSKDRNRDRIGQTYTFCSTCYTRKRRNDMKRELVKLLGGKCKNCGYDKPKSLAFHHKD